MPVPRDTTPEVSERQHETWLAASPRERIEWWNQRRDAAREMRRATLRRQHPGFSDAEINALWLEQTYRGHVPDSLLDAAIAHLRRQPEHAWPDAVSDKQGPPVGLMIT